MKYKLSINIKNDFYCKEQLQQFFKQDCFADEVSEKLSFKFSYEFSDELSVKEPFEVRFFSLQIRSYSHICNFKG